MKKEQIRARLTIYGHEEMSTSELRKFNKWLKENIVNITTYKRGELSKVFRATIYKED